MSIGDIARQLAKSTTLSIGEAFNKIALVFEKNELRVDKPNINMCDIRNSPMFRRSY